MLGELYVKNLAVIEELRLELKPGLTVLSGEEGAGKSLLVDALCLLLGGRASSGLVRHGASSAVVEGVFWCPPENARLLAALEEAGVEVDGDGTLVVARQLREQGRSVARVNGVAVPLSVLQSLGQFLVDVNSQMEHVSLLDRRRQLDLLDSHAGLQGLRESLATGLAELHRTDRELNATEGRVADRRRDLLEFQIAEIDGAAILPGEEEALEQERRVLERAEAVRESCHQAHGALYSDDISATALLHQAARALQVAVAIDPGLGSHLETLDAAAAQLEEAARDIRHYAEGVDASSGRLQEVERRLELLRRLQSKYGPSLGDVMEFADRAREELGGMVVLEEERARLRMEREGIVRQTAKLAQELSVARQNAAEKLVNAVNGELAELGMPWASFDISLAREECADGLPMSNGTFRCDLTGVDRVEFLGVTNPGEPLRPLSAIASGGETCRFMLAVKSALKRDDPVPTVVFDEVDVGVGGRSAQVVGQKLAALAEHCQVICITHLPQIACYGDHHYSVVKDVSSGRAVTGVESLDGLRRAEELAAMLGNSGDSHMLAGAQALLRRARLGGGKRVETEAAGTRGAR